MVIQIQARSRWTCLLHKSPSKFEVLEDHGVKFLKGEEHCSTLAQVRIYVISLRILIKS